MKKNNIEGKSAKTISYLLLLCAFGLGANSHADGYLDKPPEQITEAELWQEYYGWREAGETLKAHETASLLMASAAKLNGEQSVEFGRALAEVGATEVLLGQHDQALVDLTRAEEILHELPLYSEKLVSPLTYLGSALQSDGRHKEAFHAFSRAQNITHRLWGNNNPTQINITYAKAENAQAMGLLSQAEQLQRFAYKLHRINYGEISTQSIEASARLGTWLRSIGKYDESIAHFHQSLMEVQGKGPDLSESFLLLRGMAHAYRGGYRGKHARGFHQRVVDLMAAKPNHFSADQRIEAHLEFGDWLMQRFYNRPAVKQYEAAWQLANSSAVARKSWLDGMGTPTLIRYGRGAPQKFVGTPNLSRYGGMAPHDIDGENQYIRFNFDLTADGRPRHVKITRHGTDGRGRYVARAQFPKEIRYRPAIVDGQAVALAGQTVTMYLLSPTTLIEPDPVAAPSRPPGPFEPLAN